MWGDDDYDDEYYQRPGRYEVRRVYLIDPRRQNLYPPSGKGKFKFSPTEIRHLTIAYLVLVVCFSIVLSTGLGGIFMGINISWLIYGALPVSLIAVGLGFILHEVSHKFAARHYGCWSEFRYDERGLMMALFFSAIIGIVWAAPGATWFSGHVTKRENAVISLAGPSVNMIIAIILIPIILLIPLSIFTLYFLISGWIIAFLAVFNLLPIPPLDGSKIWKWNLGLYILVFAGAIAILAFYWLPLF